MKYIAIINSDEPLTEHMIQEIKDTAFCGDDHTPYVFDIEKILDMAEVPRWIPVSERLPEIGKKVLVTAYGRTCYAMMISTDKNYGYPVFRLQDSLKERVVCETTAHSDMTSSRITAWMPLPEPYKAESEGER
jgi:hypothetical protein